MEWNSDLLRRKVWSYCDEEGLLVGMKEVLWWQGRGMASPNARVSHQVAQRRGREQKRGDVSRSPLRVALSAAW